MGHQAQILMDDADAQLLRGPRGRDFDLSALVDHPAGILPVDARQHFHQCGLPGPVLSHKGMHLARQDIQTGILDGEHAGEAFGNPPQADDRLRSGGAGSRPPRSGGSLIPALPAASGHSPLWRGCLAHFAAIALMAFRCRSSKVCRVALAADPSIVRGALGTGFLPLLHSTLTFALLNASIGLRSAFLRAFAISKTSSWAHYSGRDPGTRPAR